MNLIQPPRISRDTYEWNRYELQQAQFVPYYLRFPLLLAKEAAETEKKDSFDHWLETINGFTSEDGDLSHADAWLRYEIAVCEYQNERSEAKPDRQENVDIERRRAELILDLKDVECMGNLVLCSWIFKLISENGADSFTVRKRFLEKAAKNLGELPDLIELYFFWHYGQGERIIDDWRFDEWDLPDSQWSGGIWHSKWIGRFLFVHAIYAANCGMLGQKRPLRKFRVDARRAFESLRAEIGQCRCLKTLLRVYLEGIDDMDKAKQLFFDHLVELEKVTTKAQEDVTKDKDGSKQ